MLFSVTAICIVLTICRLYIPFQPVVYSETHSKLGDTKSWGSSKHSKVIIGGSK